MSVCVLIPNPSIIHSHPFWCCPAPHVYSSHFDLFLLSPCHSWQLLLQQIFLVLKGHWQLDSLILCFPMYSWTMIILDESLKIDIQYMFLLLVMHSPILYNGGSELTYSQERTFPVAVQGQWNYSFMQHAAHAFDKPQWIFILSQCKALLLIVSVMHLIDCKDETNCMFWSYTVYTYYVSAHWINRWYFTLLIRLLLVEHCSKVLNATYSKICLRAADDGAAP